VAVAHVPGGGPAADHGTVVGLGVLHHQRVLLGGEAGLRVVLVPVDTAAQLREQRHDLLLAGSRDESRRPRVLPRVLAVGLEAPVGAPGGGHGVGIRAFQVAYDLVHRLRETVDVQAVETDLPPLGKTLVVPPEHLGEGDDLLVGPHPGRPPLKGA